MIKRSAAVLAVCACVFVFSANAADLENYESKEHAFSIHYPAKWEKKERVSGTAVMMISPKPDGKEAFRANVNVVEQDIPSDTDLKKFSSASLTVLDKLLKNFKEVERKEVTIGTTPAVRVVYTYSYDDTELKAVLVLAVQGKNGYAITCSADSVNFDTFKQSFDDVVNSFTPTK